MAKTTMVTARVDPNLKKETEKVFKELGLTTTQAITLFYKQVNLRRGLPFAVELPNAETRAAIDDALSGRNLHGAESVDALVKDLDS